MRLSDKIWGLLVLWGGNGDELRVRSGDWGVACYSVIEHYSTVVYFLTVMGAMGFDAVGKGEAVSAKEGCNPPIIYRGFSLVYCGLAAV